MNNKVFYTCITGGYDNLSQPLTIYEGYDYICYTNDIDATYLGVWEIRKIPFTHKDNTRMARYVKHNPHILLPDYEYSVWIDSNIQIVDDFLEQRIQLMIDIGSLMATIKHPYLNCIYDDATACILGANEKFWPIFEELKFLVSERYPAKNGLYETNIYYREHNHDIVRNISQQWWSMICKYSKRDQLCQCYILWKNNIVIDYLLPENISTWTEKHFIRIRHRFSIIKRVKLKLLSYWNHILYYAYNVKRIIDSKDV